jgi:Fur family transcriptional regulator, iron response regulator
VELGEGALGLVDLQADLQMLRQAGIRPTRQRVIIMRTIRAGGRRHLTPESFHRELSEAGLKLALGTVYNTLNQFASAGLLRRVGFGDRTFYCTNTDVHHHYYDEDSGRIEDIPGPQPVVAGLPELAAGYEMVGVDIMVRVRRVLPS